MRLKLKQKTVVLLPFLLSVSLYRGGCTQTKVITEQDAEGYVGLRRRELEGDGVNSIMRSSMFVIPLEISLSSLNKNR